MLALFEHLGVDYVQWKALTIAALKLDFRLSAVGRSQFRRNVGTIAGLVGQFIFYTFVGAFLASNFVTVTKRPEVEWTDIAQSIVDAIKGCLAEGGSALAPAYVPPARADQGEVVARILRILEEEIRPAVAMDGGDIVFAGFRDGVVELYMHGSCSGCPSSTATLKHGIQNLLKHFVPEVQQVEQV